MAGVGRVFQGVEYPSHREACQARHREYMRALADGLNFMQAAHAVGGRCQWVVAMSWLNASVGVR